MVELDQRNVQNREQGIKRKLVFIFVKLEVPEKNTSFVMDHTLF